MPEKSSKKRLLVLLIVLLALVLLLAHEMHRWKDLQWGIFWRQIGNLKWAGVVAGLILFYTSFVLRAWRWKMFLKGTRQTTTARMLGPTFIGFTALALIGGPASSLVRI